MTKEKLKEYAERASKDGQMINPDWLLIALENLSDN